MVAWTRVLTDVGTGGVAGVLDQVLQNQDEKRGLDQRAAGKIAADQKLPMMQQFGTYYNYGLPLLILGGIAANLIKGDMAMRLATVGGQLAGRKATHQFTTGPTSPTPSAAYTQWQRQAAREEAKRRAAERTYQPEMEQAGAF